MLTLQAERKLALCTDISGCSPKIDLSAQQSSTILKTLTDRYIIIEAYTDEILITTVFLSLLQWWQHQKHDADSSRIANYNAHLT